MKYEEGDVDRSGVMGLDPMASAGDLWRGGIGIGSREGGHARITRCSSSKGIDTAGVMG